MSKTLTHKFTLEQIQEAMESMEGFCIKCGEPREGCEPDARGYPCDACGAKSVYGAEELLFMNLVG